MVVIIDIRLSTFATFFLENIFLFNNTELPHIHNDNNVCDDG